MNGLHCAFTGRLGTEPEQKYTRNGKATLTFSVAVDQTAHQTEERPEAPETQWLRVTAWEEQATALADTLHKGGAVYVEGRLKLDRWQATDGQQRSGLSLSAWTVQPMGVGRKSTRGLGPIEPAVHRRDADALEALPF